MEIIIDNGDEDVLLSINGWNASEDSEFKTKVLKGLNLQLIVNDLKRKGLEIPEEYLIELSKI